jgi:hypothetical protein
VCLSRLCLELHHRSPHLPARSLIHLPTPSSHISTVNCNKKPGRRRDSLAMIADSMKLHRPSLSTGTRNVQRVLDRENTPTTRTRYSIMQAFMHIFDDAERASPSLCASRTTITGVIMVLTSLSQSTLSSRTVGSCQLPHIYVKALDASVGISRALCYC